MTIRLERSHPAKSIESRTHLKNRILVQDRGGAEFKTGGIRLYVEDFKRGTNPAKGGRPKDIFEMGSSNQRVISEPGYGNSQILL